MDVDLLEAAVDDEGVVRFPALPNKAQLIVIDVGALEMILTNVVAHCMSAARVDE